jgi:glycosyltransferase involved in cell wall biosynthesis
VKMYGSEKIACLFVIKDSVLNRGMNTGIENLAWGLAEAGLTVYILSGGDEPNICSYHYPDNVHYRFTGKSGDNPELFLSAFKDICNSNVIHVVVGWIINVASLAAGKDKKPTVFIGHLGQMPPRSIAGRFLKLVLRNKMSLVQAFQTVRSVHRFRNRCSHVVSISKAVQCASMPKYRLKPSQCSVIHRGVDTTIFSYSSERDASRIKLLYAGNISKGKGMTDLIESLPFIRQPVELTLCGKGEAAFINAAINASNRSRVGHKVICTGPLHQSDLIGYYQRSTVFVFPSHSEGLGKSLIEAMACGCPVICSDIPAFKEIVESHVNGIMVPVGYPVDIAKAVNIYVSRPDLRKRYALNARRTIEEKFSKVNEVNQWLMLIASCLRSTLHE